MAKDKIFGKDTVAGMNEVKDAAAQINNILNDIDISELSTGMGIIANASKDMSNDLSNSVKYSKDNKNLANDQSKAALLGVKYATSKNKLTKTFRSLQISMLKGQDEFTQGIKESSEEWDNLKGKAKDFGDTLLSSASQIDTAFGGMGSKIGGFLTNPLTAAVAILLTFNAQQEAIADQFGAIGVTEFRQELAGASQEFVKLGYTSAEAMTTTSAIANNFGMGVSQAAGMADEVANLAKSTGTSVGDSATLVGLFTKTQGLSAEQAMNLSKSTVALAEANDVAPDKVLSDVAGNTDLFAKFAKDGGKNVMRAAVQARKLGIEISSVASAASGLLDFESSLNAEMEASIMIGRNVNLQRARELSLAGDLEGLQQELLQQVGSEAEFNELNTLQRQSLAKAMNMSVAEVQKLVAGEKEALTLSGALSTAASKTIIPDETLTATAQILNDLKAVGMELAETIGPAFNSLVGLVNVFLGALEKTVGVGPGLLAIFVALKAHTAFIALKGKQNAAAMVLASFVKNPIAGAIGLGLGVAGVAAGMSAINSKTASAQEGGITSQEGLVNVHPQEAIVPIEKLGGFIADAMKPVKEEISNLRNDMKLYLEFGGQVAPAIGKSVVGGIESIA